MKRIPLTQGKFAIVDDEDYDRLTQWKWYAYYCTGHWYASRKARKDNKKISIAMHREILRLKRGDGKYTDHINHNGLDNQKANLRSCTNAENIRNQKRLSLLKTSKYKGVSWDKKTKSWYATIGYNYKTLYLGNFNDEIEAAKTYDRKAKELFGEFAYCNFRVLYPLMKI